MLRRCLAVVVLLAAPAAVPCQPIPESRDTLAVDLETARRIGLAARPELLAARSRLAAARGDRRQAGAYPFNPQAQVKVPTVLDPGDWGAMEALFTQEVEWAGQWGPRKAAAEATVTAAQEGVVDAARTSLYEIDVAFYRAVAAERRTDVRAEGLALSERLANAVHIQLREGRTSALEANLAQIEAGRAHAAARSARRAYVTALLELRRTLGLSPEQPLRLVGDGLPGPDPDALDPDSLVAAALAARPDLRAAEAAVERWRAEGSLAGRSIIPNLRLSAVATRSGVGLPMHWGLQVALPVPLWNRNSGLQDAARGQAGAAEAERAAVELRIRTEVAASLEAGRAAREELEVFDAQVLQPARANQALLETAFAEGRFDLPTVLLLRAQLLDAEIAYWDAWLADRSAWAALQAAVGEGTDGAE
jgi:cobalt-zinc-cadmium efflux system outer membrane protein